MSQAAPFFSICIPQYNRTDFLIKACETFAKQGFRDFELCISDDCSTDGREGALIDRLGASGLRFAYARTERNLRYDGNLRNAIALSRGRYVLLMGNDDGLSDGGVLQFLHDQLASHAPIAAAICNYRDASSGEIFRRMRTTGVLGSGPELAAALFRRYSFVGGVILEGDGARSAATASLDGSEMYQMYLGTRLVAAGGRFLAIDRVCVDMGLQIAGQAVDSYRRLPRVDPCPIVERPLPLGRLLEVVAAGLSRPGAPVSQRDVMSVARQLYAFIYPFWVIEYRRVQSWKFALGMLLALRPSRISRGVPVSALNRAAMWLLYAVSAAGALTFPIRLFDFLRPRLYAFAKRIGSVPVP